MPVSYDKLWKLLIDKKMNRTELKEAAGISFNVLAKMGKSEFISMESLYKICLTLDCDIGDVIEFTEKGREKAQNIYERHRVLTKALEKVGASAEMAEENACRIEHVISEEMFEVIKKFVNEG